ncbi:MAG: hypothetical protein IKC38_00690 [Clostridia bacterium]|nr:hypothetical protein [Clostridia bacterium]
MDNRTKRFITILAICLLLICVSACGMEPTTDSGIVFTNIQNSETLGVDVFDQGAYWIKSLDEYKQLGLAKKYEESFFEDKALFVLAIEWPNYGDKRTLTAVPIIEDGTLYPVINIHNDSDLASPAFTTTIMIAEVDKEYADMPVGEPRFTYSGKGYDYKNQFVFHRVSYVNPGEAHELQKLGYGIHWVKTYEEYRNLEWEGYLDEAFFEDNVLLFIKTEWSSSTPSITLIREPVVEGNVYHPVLNVHVKRDTFDEAMSTSIIYVKVEKKYEDVTIGDIKFSYSGSFYEKEENKQHNFYVEMTENK